ncbi:GDNF-inducible zinc finger protein 1-like [Sitophilus oryzae]|uniref:GDNF-inducible zinc finger protein 1-like n=1 Tax=Sitophilus oryzae TaxID=7048 RepID=A0A6J2YR97_SITOR|nr:GDNF-inducible zinc finger protein 1-like [Sitophilus oryzae]
MAFGLGERLTCHKCNSSFKNECNLAKHIKYECGKEARFFCDHCSTKSKRRYDIKMHMFKQHGVPFKKEKKNGDRLTCHKCHKSLKNKMTLRKHVKYQCGKEATYFCNYCPLKSKRHYDLKMHIYNKHAASVLKKKKDA